MNGFGKRIDGPGGRRAIPRKTVLLSGSVKTLNCTKIVVMLDVSTTGARLHGAHALEVGEDVWVKVDCLDTLATVVWADGEELGIRFDQELGPEALNALRSDNRWMLGTSLSPEQRLAIEDWQGGLAR